MKEGEFVTEVQANQDGSTILKDHKNGSRRQILLLLLQVSLSE